MSNVSGSEAVGEAPLRLESPGLAGRKELGAAYELKFQLSEADMASVEAWARRTLRPDDNGDDGSYRVTSIYCDTPALDVYHKSPRYRGSKLRLRRYGSAPFIYLERKSKRGDRVRKKRVSVSPEELVLLADTAAPADWVGAWFHECARARNLSPVCRVQYRRTAFNGIADGLPVRLTVDRELTGTAAAGWNWQTALQGTGAPLLPGGALLELKFHAQIPALFRDLLPGLPAQTARISKYRRCIELSDSFRDRIVVPADSPLNGLNGASPESIASASKARIISSTVPEPGAAVKSA